MTIMTATEVSRNFSRVLDSVEHGEREVGIVRNKHPVARLVPEAKAMTAVEALGDLYSTLSAEEGAAWMDDIGDLRRWTAAETRVDPWA